MQGGLPRGVKVLSRSRKNIRFEADHLRSILGLNQPYVDVLRLLEHQLTNMGVVFHVAETAELEDNEALTFPELKEIHIREDVHEALCRRDPRARFTVVHEVGHLLLHPDVALARSARQGCHAYFEDSEWQADCFAAEFLMPARMVAKWYSTANAVSEDFGVSLNAAIIRVQVLRSEGLMPRQ